MCSSNDDNQGRALALEYVAYSRGFVLGSTITSFLVQPLILHHAHVAPAPSLSLGSFGRSTCNVSTVDVSHVFVYPVFLSFFSLHVDRRSTCFHHFCLFLFCFISSAGTSRTRPLSKRGRKERRNETPDGKNIPRTFSTGPADVLDWQVATSLAVTFSPGAGGGGWGVLRIGYAWP